jgi:hypothetical protein
MATFEEGLKVFVETNVPSAGSGHPNQVPQDAAYPCWAYEVTSDIESLTHSGRTGWHSARVTLTFLAASYSAVKSISNALRGALDGYVGAMGTKSVQYCHVEQAVDLYADLHDLPAARLELVFNYV